MSPRCIPHQIADPRAQLTPPDSANVLGGGGGGLKSPSVVLIASASAWKAAGEA